MSKNFMIPLSRFEGMKCRFGCDEVFGIYYVPEGCVCWSDPVQALCAQHAYKIASAGLSGGDMKVSLSITLSLAIKQLANKLLRNGMVKAFALPKGMRTMDDKIMKLILISVAMVIGFLIGYFTGRDTTLWKFMRKRTSWACDCCGAVDSERDGLREIENVYGCPECGNFTYKSKIVYWLPPYGDASK